MQLRYGMNPHQKGAEISGSNLPFAILNGAPGYINVLDALNSWQLVKELKTATGQAAASSFKHVNPAGAAIGRPLPEKLKRVYFADSLDTSPLARAYLRARGCDRISSFGDFIALSDIVDEPTALIIKREVSDGVIAPGYSPEALKILKQKKKGNFLIMEIDENYHPEQRETRTVYGVTIEQDRNNLKITKEHLQNIVTKNNLLTDLIIEDILVGLITLKYTQSNSICITFDGQTIGIGAGQQSRIHCTQLALSKAMNWKQRQDDKVLGLELAEGLTRTEKDIQINNFIETELPQNPEQMKSLENLVLASDGFIPQRDNIDLAASYGIKHIVQPGNSIRDQIVIDACDEHNMVMLFTGVRLFHH